MEAGFAVVVLAGEAKVDGSEVGRRLAHAEGLSIPLPHCIACFVGADPQRSEVVGVQVGQHVAGVNLGDWGVASVEI